MKPTDENEARDEEAQSDPFFMPWRSPRSDPAERIVGNAIRLVEDHEQRQELRRRRRRPADQAVFEETVTAVVSDALYHGLLGERRWLAVTRSNRKLGAGSRYRPPALSKTLPAVLDRLEAVGLIRQRLGQARTAFQKGVTTTIKASRVLLKQGEASSIGPEDFQRLPAEEIIVLRGPKQGRRPGPDLEYRDNAYTRQARSELQTLNAWLEQADLSFDAAVLEDDDRAIDTSDRRLRRIFTRGSFESGGRLFGGFWQRLKSSERLAGLTIDDAPAAYLDYGQMTARIAYGEAGADLPPGDLYVVAGLEPFREGVKKLISALLFADTRLQRKPQGTARLLPRHYSMAELTERVRQAHGPIANFFERGMGHHLQFRESEVLVAALLALRDAGIPALPVHDAVLVRYDQANTAAETMVRVFREKIGVDAEVRITWPRRV